MPERLLLAQEYKKKQPDYVLQPGNLVWGSSYVDENTIPSIVAGIKPSKYLQNRHALRPDSITCAILPHPFHPDQTSSNRFKLTGSYGLAASADPNAFTIIISRYMILRNPLLFQRAIANGTYFFNPEQFWAYGPLSAYRDHVNNQPDPSDKTIFGFPIKRCSEAGKPHANEISFYYPEPVDQDNPPPFITPDLWGGIIAHPQILTLFQQAADKLGVQLPPFLTYTGDRLNVQILPYTQ